MKILFLNPNIDAQHKLCAALQGKGAMVLVPGNLDEAWKMIQVYGTSLDLAIIHREGLGKGLEDQGERLVALIKADPAQADLPIILSSAVWNDADFYKHQKSNGGVNAYLRWPFDEAKLFETIDSMFGGEAFPSAVAEAPKAAVAAPEIEVAKSLPSVSIEIDVSQGSIPSSIEIEKAATMIRPKPLAPKDSKDEKPEPLEMDDQAERELGQDDQEPAAVEPVASMPAEVQLELAGGPGSTQSAQSPTKESAGSGMDLNQLMNEELEPHERLELARQQGANADASTNIMDLEKMREEGAAGDAEEPGDDDLASELPYLFRHRKKRKEGFSEPNPDLVFAEPVGDAVIPGGAGLAPDIDTLKKYLYLREQDVTILSNQLKSAMEQVGARERELKEERGKNLELTHTVDEQKRRISEFEKEKAIALSGVNAELEELRFQNKAKADKARALELQVKEAAGEIQNLKERVRMDIRKIRVREKELENKLEIVKKDSEALIAARETKIVELKRKVDLLEFNIDLLQDQLSREKDSSAQLRERLGKAAQVVRVAEGLLDTPGTQKSDSDVHGGTRTEVTHKGDTKTDRQAS